MNTEKLDISTQVTYRRLYQLHLVLFSIQTAQVSSSPTFTVFSNSLGEIHAQLLTFTFTSTFTYYCEFVAPTSLILV